MELTEQELIKKNIRMNRFKILMDVILILVIIAIGYYIFSEIEAFKILGKDVCLLCEQQTGGSCISVSRISVDPKLLIP